MRNNKLLYHPNFMADIKKLAAHPTVTKYTSRQGKYRSCERTNRKQ